MWGSKGVSKRILDNKLARHKAFSTRAHRLVVLALCCTCLHFFLGGKCRRIQFVIPPPIKVLVSRPASKGPGAHRSENGLQLPMCGWLPAGESNADVVGMYCTELMSWSIPSYTWSQSVKPLLVTVKGLPSWVKILYALVTSRLQTATPSLIGPFPSKQPRHVPSL